MRHTKRTGHFQGLITDLLYHVQTPERAAQLTQKQCDVLSDILRRNTTDIACIVKAADDEPIFPLRAHDPIAGFIVQIWVDYAKAGSLHIKKLKDAQECADQMQAYPKKGTGR